MWLVSFFLFFFFYFLFSVWRSGWLTDLFVAGRVLGAGPDRVWDLKDDFEGRDGAEGTEYFHREVLPGWYDYAEKMRLLIEGEGPKA